MPSSVDPKKGRLMAANLAHLRLVAPDPAPEPAAPVSPDRVTRNARALADLGLTQRAVFSLGWRKGDAAALYTALERLDRATG